MRYSGKLKIFSVTYHSTGIQIGLQATIRPSLDSLVKGILGSLGCGVRGLGSSGPDVRSGGAECRGSSARDGIAQDFSPVLADKRTKLVELGALGNWELLECERRCTARARTNH